MMRQTLRFAAFYIHYRKKLGLFFNDLRVNPSISRGKSQFTYWSERYIIKYKKQLLGGGSWKRVKREKDRS